MPKNIVLMSDGTGNSSAALFTTNVWRLYQALDVADPARQVAYYHDGVGSSGYKPLKAVAGIVGYGLKRSVLDMYMFLCRSYEEGDRIYCFGFSRGSFAVRILVGLVATQGLAPYAGYEKQLANDARAAYRRFRKNFKTTFQVERPLRWLRDLWYSRRDPRSRTVRFNDIAGRDPRWIHFVGLWDTVDAYGGPIEEITDAIDYWLWPLSMPDQVMSHKLRRACHALALDDERRAFWPQLWREGVIKGKDHKVRRLEEDQEWKAITADEVRRLRSPEVLPPNYAVPEIDKDRLTQVWFAGMHADVGGGYSQDGLSYVALEWMIDRAKTYGLLLKKEEEARLRCCVNPLDKLNDSRSGFGAYYRYQPRNLELLRDAGWYAPFCFRVWTRMLDAVRNAFHRPVRKEEEIQILLTPPVVHESVFKRLDEGVNAYAPVALPARYRITDKDGNWREGPYRPTGARTAQAAQPATQDRIQISPPRTQGEDKLAQQDRVWNLVWARRVVYFTTVLVSVAVFAFPIYNHCSPKYVATHWGAKYLSPILGVADNVVPFASHWTKLAKVVPEAVFAGVLVIVGLLLLSGHLQRLIGDLMRQVWRKRLGEDRDAEQPWTAPWPADSQGVYWLRTRAWYRELFAALRTCIFPTLLVWGIPSLILRYVLMPKMSQQAFDFCWWVLVLGWGAWAVVNIWGIVQAKHEEIPGARA
jgi:uncharacterized protein (DUF2235 family)